MVVRMMVRMTRYKGQASRFQGRGGVTGKGQDRDEIGTRLAQNTGFRGKKKFSGGG